MNCNVPFFFIFKIMITVIHIYKFEAKMYYFINTRSAINLNFHLQTCMTTFSILPKVNDARQVTIILLVNQTVSWLVGQSVGQSISQSLINHPVIQSICLATVHQQTELVDRSVCLVGGLFGQSVWQSLQQLSTDVASHQPGLKIDYSGQFRVGLFNCLLTCLKLSQYETVMN